MTTAARQHGIVHANAVTLCPSFDLRRVTAMTMMWLVLLLTGCETRAPLYSNLSERDANDVTASLVEHGLSAQKVASGKQLFAVEVPTRDFAKAVEVLRANGLPRNAFTRMGDVFKKDGMISSPTEERARYLAALAQELENTLSQIDGVVVARVHPVLPERIVPGEPVLPSSCSVMIKHVPDWSPALYEARIRRLVLSSIPGLAESPDKIAVVFVPSEAPPHDTPAPAEQPMLEHSAGPSKKSVPQWGWSMAAAAILAGIGLPAVWLWWPRRKREAPRRSSARNTRASDVAGSAT